MIRGAPSEQERGVARAVELGITYVDTAAMYGGGRSETNLGRVLATLRPDVVLASKVRVSWPSEIPIAQQIADSADASLRRLQRGHIDVFQLHTPTMSAPERDELSVRQVLDEVVPAFERLREAGKIRFFGFSGTGDPHAMPDLVESGAFDVAQIIYNVLNPSAGGPSPARAAGPDYGGILHRTHAAGMGAVAIRVLAGGAVSEHDERHPVASDAPFPMGSSPDYAEDVAHARALLPLLRDGVADTLPELALRFALAQPALSVALIGFSDLAQIEAAAAAAERGPLPQAALDRIAALRSSR
jgi:aryl-alcohol dehydrogenase-like predicted oxidoreductase